MPQILSQQPRWLSRGTPGHALFQASASSGRQQQPPLSDIPFRRLAHRGTEVFVAVDNELRWSDVTVLQDSHDTSIQVYRVLKTSIHRPILQLSISPSGNLLAICTSHTVHIAQLPASSHLYSGDSSPWRVKTFQLGPTCHVLEQSPLVSAIWHPLSVSGETLITVTKEACVRLWELDAGNRASFDAPELAVDLKKLANATSLEKDLGASRYGVSKGFSPDNVEMEVGGACFGGTGEDGGWGSMTLWVGMREGDVYALCPFLPKNWRAPVGLVEGLSTSVAAKLRATSQDEELTPAERRKMDQQARWLGEVDEQEPVVEEDGYGGCQYTRPERLGAIARLQGPFLVDLPMDAGEITDVHVTGAQLVGDGMPDEEEVYEDDADEDGLSIGVVCLATNAAKVHICLDLEGVEAEWLPSKRSRTITLDSEDEKSLLLFETISLSSSPTDGPTAFTLSPTSRYEILTTSASGIHNLDLSPWTTSLESELASDSDAGLDFRLSVLLSSHKTEIIPLAPHTAAEPLNTAIAIPDPSTNTLILLASSLTTCTPLASTLALPLPLAHAYAPDSAPLPALPAPETRAPYEPAPEFFRDSALPSLMKSAEQRRLLGADLKGQVRYSSATLQLMTEAHRILAAETHALGLAAAELFRVCERMRLEAQEQVRKVQELVGKVDGVVGGVEGEGKGGLDERILRARERNGQLNGRVERLRKRMGRLGPGGARLSERERAFAEEVARVEASLGQADEDGNGDAAETPDAPTSPNALLKLENSPASKWEHDAERRHDRGPQPNSSGSDTISARFAAIRALQQRLLEEAKEVAAQQQQHNAGAHGRIERGVGPSEFRRRKMEQVRRLLERETALIEGVGERLARLSAAGA